MKYSIDFSRSLIAGDFLAFPAVGSQKTVFVIPTHFRLSGRTGMAPGFLLESVRGITPFSPPPPHGILEIRLEPDQVSEAVASAAGEQWPEAELIVPDMDSGFLRFHLVGNDEPGAAELEQPVKLNGMSFGSLRYIREISPDAVLLLKKGLQNEQLLLETEGIFSLKGYTGQKNVIIKFNPSRLVEVMTAGGVLADRKISADALEALMRKPDELPLTITGEPGDTREACQIFTDWYTSRFCSLDETSTKDHLIFQLSDEAHASGEFTWDLSEPFITSRYFSFTLDTLSDARKLVATYGLETLCPSTVIASLPHGVLRVVISHPFQQLPKGVLRAGIRLEADANPPSRPQAIQQSVWFDHGQQREIAEMRFSLEEESSFRYTPVLVIADHDGTREVRGTALTGRERFISVSLTDYPVEMMSLSVSANLMDIAVITYSLQDKEGNDLLAESLVFDQEEKDILVMVPENDGTLNSLILAREKSTGNTVTTLVPFVPSLKIDLPVFREYGRHTITLINDTGNEPDFTLEFLPQWQEETRTDITPVFFPSGVTQRTWSWFSPTIFQPGFRYRTILHTGEPSAWSEVISPFAGQLSLSELIINHPQ